MTDYLEFQTEEGVDALWEAARRLDNVLTQLEEPGVRASRAAGGPTNPGERSAGSGAQAEEPPLALLAAVRELDGAVARSETAPVLGGTGAAREGKAPWDMTAERRLSSGLSIDSPEGPAAAGMAAGVSVSPMSWGAENGQAERLDLLFRRDSRRYDGGFFLY